MLKTYTRPSVTVTPVALGVFGTYGCDDGGGGWSWGWGWGWFWGWWRR
ncbi:hypothetical protein GF314_09835 [bacterium]|nr:hypothetical protein [bacterium]